MNDANRANREWNAVVLVPGARWALIAGRPGLALQDWAVTLQNRNRTIVGRFERDHPYVPPRFTITPPPSSTHYYDDGRGMHLCYCLPSEWNPDWTIATALGIVCRFLAEEDRSRSTTVTRSSLLSEVLSWLP